MTKLQFIFILATFPFFFFFAGYSFRYLISSKFSRDCMYTLKKGCKCKLNSSLVSYSSSELNQFKKRDKLSQ